jgi:hypothetical protein
VKRYPFTFIFIPLALALLVVVAIGVNGGQRHQPARAIPPGMLPSHVDAPVPAPCPPSSQARTRISVACARSGQGYPFSLGVEYIAVSPAAAPVGASVRVWGSCGCGESGTPAPGAPVETVRLWLLDARPLVVTRQKQRRVVNAGHALLGTATIDGRSNWSARVTVPTHMDAGAGPPGRTTTTPGIYAIMVTYPGEVATARYDAVTPREGYITRFIVTAR